MRYDAYRCDIAWAVVLLDSMQVVHEKRKGGRGYELQLDSENMVQFWYFVTPSSMAKWM